MYIELNNNKQIVKKTATPLIIKQLGKLQKHAESGKHVWQYDCVGYRTSIYKITVIFIPNIDTLA